MSEESESALSRRALLKRTATAGAALTVGSGLGSAGHGSPTTVPVEFHFDEGVNPDKMMGRLQIAMDEIESQTVASFDVVGTEKFGNTYSGNYGEVMDEFEWDHGGVFAPEKLSVLVYSQSPWNGAPAVSHRGDWGDASNPPNVVINKHALGTVGIKKRCVNTAITGLLRPILSSVQAGRAPDPNDVNSFGTVHEGYIPNAASPLATWHARNRLGCVGPEGEIDIGDINSLGDLLDEFKQLDNAKSFCGFEDANSRSELPAVCNWVYKLSDCTVAAVNDVLAGIPTVTGNQKPTDPDGDGLYEDVNGNGRQDIADATALFQNSGEKPVSSHPEAFDFNDSGSIEIGDAVALFRENTN